jgi:hypothetical protein
LQEATLVGLSSVSFEGKKIIVALFFDTGITNNTLCPSEKGLKQYQRIVTMMTCQTRLFSTCIKAAFGLGEFEQEACK